MASTLTRYRTVEKIASGGMATVTLAEDTLLGRRVALKRMIGTGDTQGISRLRREALVGASVSHPNLVSIYDVISQDDDLVIVMEYVDGTTLKDSIGQNGPMPTDQALPVLRGVAAALDAIHERGIVHRDVKPPNILLGRRGEVKLADLGIASAPGRTRITTEGSVLGSFSYMSPEQLEGAPATPAMDVYALSAVAYEALSGRRARQQDNPLALARAISSLPPPDLTDAWPEAPAAAAALLKRGMSRNPSERPGSAGELVQRLEEGLATGEADRRPTEKTKAIAAIPAPRPGSRRPMERPRETRYGKARRTWLAPALLGLVVLAVLIAVLASSGGTPKPAATTHRTTAHHRSAPAKATAGAKSKRRSHPLAVPPTSSSQPPGGATTVPPATTGPPAGLAAATTPVAATERFYELAASHHYSAAWALAAPAFRSQLGGYDSFVSGQSGDRRIIFRSARVTDQSPSSATVAIRTTSIRDNGTQQCGGTVNLVPSTGADGWLLHQIDINCS